MRSENLRNNKEEWKKKQEYFYILQEGVCQYCGWKLGDTYTLDHIIPKSCGGRDDDSNLRLSCYVCNVFKSSYNIPQFKKRIESTLLNNWLGWHMNPQAAELVYRIRNRYRNVKPLLFYYERKK